MYNFAALFYIIQCDAIQYKTSTNVKRINVISANRYKENG